MDDKIKIGTWQLFSILLISRLLSTITFMPILSGNDNNADYIVSMLLSGVLIAFFSIPTFLTIKNTQGLTQLADKVSNKLTRFISLLYSVFLLMFIFSTLVRMNLFVSAVVFPQKSITVFILLSIIAVCYAASHGIEAIGRSGTISLIIVAASFLLMLSSLRERVDINNLSPILYNGIKSVTSLTWQSVIRTIEPAILMLVLPKVSGNIKKGYLVWLIAFPVVSTVIIFFLMTTLGDAALLQLFPVYSMTVLSQFSVFERLDALLIGVWILSAFIKVSFLICLISQLISDNFKKVKKSSVITFTGVIISIAVLIQANSISFFKIITSIKAQSVIFITFIVLIPFLLYISGKYVSGAKDEKN